MTITPTHILEYLYCPRFTYFEYVLCIPQFEDRFYKVVRGREVHEEKARQNMAYVRVRIGVVQKWIRQYLTNGYLRGEVDEVLFLNDDTAAPLDYKFAEYKDKIYNTYQTQLQCYAVLIEDNFKKQVDKGFIVYTRSANKLIEVPISTQDKNNVKQTIEDVITVIEKNIYPRGTKEKKKCVTCTYKNICTQ